MVLPPMLKAATPVGAVRTTGEVCPMLALKMSSCSKLIVKDLPVPAPPVTNSRRGVWSLGASGLPSVNRIDALDADTREDAAAEIAANTVMVGVLGMRACDALQGHKDDLADPPVADVGAYLDAVAFGKGAEEEGGMLLQRAALGAQAPDSGLHVRMTNEEFGLAAVR